MEPNQDFFKEEIRCGYTISTKMKRVWAKEIEMLLEIDKICQKYKIKYLIDSGSLLGTIRHKGFIPWDDDIDIIMMRQDYNRFRKAAEKELKYPYFYQTAYSDDHYYRGHGQLRNSETTAILKNEGIYVPYNQGIFVDIFVMDHVSKYIFFRQLKCNIVILFNNLFNLYWEDHKGIKKMCKKILRLIPFKYLFGFYELLLSINIGRDNKIANVSFYKNLNEYRLLDDDIFNNIEYMPFEYITVPVPVKYDKVLTTCYGDYMVMKQIPTDHGNVIFDAGISYVEMIDKIKKGEYYE